MKLYRIGALIERDMRKFFRSPALMMSSMIFPLVQLVVLGYAFGGKIHGAVIGVVDQDQTVESRRVREMFDGITAGPKTFSARSWRFRTTSRAAFTSAIAHASRLRRTTPISSFPVRCWSACNRWWTR